MEEIRSEGFVNSQVDRIAERAGVARGTFYFHFPTREHVLLELQRRYETDIVSELEAGRRTGASLAALLQRVVDAILAAEEALGDPRLLRDIFSLYVRQQVEFDFDQEPLLRALEQYFGDAADRGEVRRDLTPQELTLLFMTNLFGSLLSEGPGAERRSSLKRVIAVFVRGVAP